jgi:hypothetical protein
VASNTRITDTAIDIRLHTAPITDFDVLDVLPHFQNLNTELMARYSRIREVRKLAQVTSDVRSANPNTMDAHQRLVVLGAGWFGDINLVPKLRFS